MTPLVAVYIAAVVTTVAGLLWAVASHALAHLSARSLAAFDRERS